MARTKQDTAITRKHVISLYLTDTEYDLIRQNAASAGLSLSAYVRKLVLDGRVEVRYLLSPQVSELGPILGQLGRIGSNLNQIARYFNFGGDATDDIKEDLRQCMKKLLLLRNELAQLNN